MSLSDLIQRDAERVFGKDFVETIRYRTAAGEVLAFSANVFRKPLEQQKEDRGRSMAWPLTVAVPRTRVAAVDTNGDAVELRRHPGDPAPAWLPVTAIVKQDEGMWLVAAGR